MKSRSGYPIDPKAFHDDFDEGNLNSSLRNDASNSCQENNLDYTSRDVKHEMIHVLSTNYEPQFIKDFMLRRLLTPHEYSQYRQSQDVTVQTMDPSCFLDYLSPRDQETASYYLKNKDLKALAKYIEKTKQKKAINKFEQWLEHNSHDSDKGNAPANSTTELNPGFSKINGVCLDECCVKRSSNWKDEDQPKSHREVRPSDASNSSLQAPLRESNRHQEQSFEKSLYQQQNANTTYASKAAQSTLPISAPPVNAAPNSTSTGKAISESFACSLASDIGPVSSNNSPQVSKSSWPKSVEKYPDLTNILVLGETGVGKSTFINGIANYLNYDTMDEALTGGVKVIIDSAFVLTDDNMKTHEIRSNATIGAETNVSTKSNESRERGQSATQDPKSYLISFGPKEKPNYVRIIDTPGIGDTRGTDQDKANFQKIISFISKYSDIHGICILIKPNTTRLSAAFRFCIDELLVHLHKSASKNLLFCFTHTRGTLYKPGDTLPILKEHLLELQSRKNVRIALNKETVYSFDNESFRFLCAKKKEFPFTVEDTEQFDESWRRSTEETRRLFDRTSQLPAHSVRDTLSLNNTKNMVSAMLKPLVSIVKIQMTNKQLMRQQAHEVEEAARTGNVLRQHLYVNQVVLNTVRMDYPQTVCTSYCCVEHLSVTGSTRGRSTTNYKTVCHDHCYLKGVEVETMPNSDIKGCSVMTSSGSCKKCGCSWDRHMHVTYRLKESVQSVIDPAVLDSIKRKDDASDTINVYLKATNSKTSEIDSEYRFILSCCAQFSHFLKTNSIVSYNDLFIQYLDHTITEEDDLVRNGHDPQLLSDLMMMKGHYQSLVQKVKDTKKTKSPDEIEELMTHLSSLKHCGSVVGDVSRVRQQVMNQNEDPEGQLIRLNGGV